MSIGTKIYTALCGVEVGRDEAGNRYFRARRTKKGEREKRWVMYKGYPEPTKISSVWYSWLHHLSNDTPQSKRVTRFPWEKPHKPNPSGTAAAYVPPGHILRGGERYEVESDYQPWQP